MRVRVVEPERLDAVGAELVATWLRATPTATVLAAMGTSPLGIYARLGDLGTSGAIDLSALRLVQLDEYVDVADDDRRSLFGWLLRDVAAKLGVDRGRILRIAGDAPDPAAEARRHDAAIAAAGGLQVSVLGLGPNGHLGFNEPPSAADAPTRAIDLTEASLASNARYWGSRSEVPRRAITVGMNRLVAAERTLLVVKGRAKVDVLRRLVTEPVSDELPASHLRGIEGVTLLADADAWSADVPVPATIGP